MYPVCWPRPGRHSIQSMSGGCPKEDPGVPLPSGCYLGLEASLLDTPVRLELQGHRLLLGGQLEARGHAGPAQVQRVILRNTRHVEVILRLTVLHILYVELAERHLQLSFGCSYRPFADLVLGVF